MWINTADAAKRGISDGEMVKVNNDRGTILVPAKVTERMAVGAVSIESGAWYRPDKAGDDIGANANTLTSDDISPVGVYQYNTSLVEVEKA